MSETNVTRPHWRRFRLRADLVTAGATVEESGLTNISLGTSFCQLTIGIGTDHTAQLLVSLDTCLAHPDLFEELPPE